MDFDARIAGPRFGRTDVAEEHAAAGLPKNLAAATVISGVVTEGFGRNSGLDVGLRDAVRRPGLGATGFQDQRGFESNGGRPKGVNAGRVSRQDDAEGMAARE